MLSNAETVAAVNAATATLAAVKTAVTKIGTETVGLQDKIKALMDDKSISPELETALGELVAMTDSIASSVKTVDDLVPDATV